MLDIPNDHITTFALCREFGWTPKQLFEQDSREISRMILIMNELNALNGKENAESGETTILFEDDE